MTRRIFKIAFIPLLAVAIGACDKKKQDEVAAAVTGAGHNPANCPKLDSSNYTLDTGGTQLVPGATAKFINVWDDKDNKVLVLSFNGIEQVATTGKSEGQPNGGSLTAGCVRDVKNNDDTIQVSGTGLKGAQVRLNIKPDDKGLVVGDYHYTKAGPVNSTLVEGKKAFSDLVKNKSDKTGLPQKEDVK